jgi:ATP-dependent DNA helicase RecG
MEELPNKLRDLLGIVADIDLLEEDGKPYLRIAVEPYPVPISYRGEYHYRSGSTKQVLKGAALDRFLLGKPGRRWDAVPVPGVAVADLDAAVLARFRERAARSKRLDPEALKEHDPGLIEKLRLTESDYLRRTAVLLFHPDPERFFTGAAVKIGHVASESDLRYHDEIRGDLFTQVEQTMDRLLTKYLKAVISYEGIQRVESYPMPESALREAVLNAVVHRDYAVPAPIQIRVYRDRLRIWNPAWGRGIERIFGACHEAGTPEPRIRVEPRDVWVEFPFSAEYLDSLESGERGTTQETARETSEKTSRKTSVETSGASGKTGEKLGRKRSA